MESPHAHLLGGTRSALAAAAAAVLLLSAGDGLLAAVLLGVAAGDPLPGTVAVLAVLGVLARFGTTSLPALAGAQAVLGPAVSVGPPLAAASAVLAAVALIAVAPPDWRGWVFGLLAGLVVAGPSAASTVDGLIRAAGVLVGVGAVLAGQRWWRWEDRPFWLPRAALATAAVALALAVVA